MFTKGSESSLDVRRYRGLLICAGYLLASALLLNLALEQFVGRLQSPDKWYQLDRSFLDLVGGKSQKVALGFSPQPEPLVVTLGSSAMRLGIDSTKAEELSGVPWLNLGVLGASLVTVGNHLAPYARSGLQPDVVVLGFNSCWLGRDRSFRENSDTYRPKSWTWISRNQKPLADWFTRELLLARGRWGLFRWPSELWHTTQKFFRTVTPSFLEWQMRQVTARGYFHADNYRRRDNEEAIALAQILAELKRLGSKRVLLIDMPVHSEIRRRTPVQASEAVLRCVSTVAMPQLEFVDLSSALPDSAFVDLFHVNAQGEVLLTEALAKALGPGVSSQ